MDVAADASAGTEQDYNRFAQRCRRPDHAAVPAALRPWIRRYNHQRPHRGIGMKTPMARLRASRERRARVRSPCAGSR
ncbi:MAG: transposase [Deltaproteobacteria bacterium]|nr:transposase [Deltaproteobacteria bacterium]